MRIDIGGGVRLFVDVDGMGWIPRQQALVQRPTLLLLHGGPGLDHSGFKLGLSDLRDVAQVVMYDHRGQGRSDARPPDEWGLDTLADDVVRLCDALGIEQPIVFGHSFGGFVAQRYLGRHPLHPAKVILSSTAARTDVERIIAKFHALGGAPAGAAAAAFWRAPTAESALTYMQVCGPLYTRAGSGLPDGRLAVQRPEVAQHFISGEQGLFDLRGDLARAVCPVLVLAGEHDPVCPIESAEEIVEHLPPQWVRFERFPDSGHGVFHDEPTRALEVLRGFISQPSPVAAR